MGGRLIYFLVCEFLQLAFKILFICHVPVTSYSLAHLKEKNKVT
jgi:hypothetical protein